MPASPLQTEGSSLLPQSTGPLLVSTTEKSNLDNGALYNFIKFSFLFSASPCCVLSCMAFATARLGSIGAWQSGVIYFTYTLSSVMGATSVIKRLGARNSIILGMMFYLGYVACFIVATTTTSLAWLEAPCALLGAAIGGVGGGILWTAQGVYFSQAAQYYQQYHEGDANMYLAGIFSAIYLAIEATLDVMPTVLISSGIVSWSAIFGVYSIIALFATIGMLWVQDFPSTDSTTVENVPLLRKTLATWYLLVEDPKMRYLIGINATYGLGGAFVLSYVNGEVVRIVLQDSNSKYVGALVAWAAMVASALSVVFYGISRAWGKTTVQVTGCLAYLCVILPFLVVPNLQDWGWMLLLWVYFMYGAGRATFEGNLKAIFAEYFPQEKEGAYSNIVLQSGLSSIVGFAVSYGEYTSCTSKSHFCVLYNNGTHHNMLILESMCAFTGILAIFSFLRAAHMFEREKQG